MENYQKMYSTLFNAITLGGAGGEVETPPAFLLGDSKGEVLF